MNVKLATLHYFTLILSRDSTLNANKDVVTTQRRITDVIQGGWFTGKVINLFDFVTESKALCLYNACLLVFPLQQTKTCFKRLRNSLSHLQLLRQEVAPCPSPPGFVD